MSKRATVFWTEWGCGFQKEFSSRKAAFAFAKLLGVKRRYYRIV